MVKTIEFRNRAMIVADPTMEKTLEMASKAAKSLMPVLIVGPSGTGKELFARYIHEKSSQTGAFVSINCAAIPEGLMEAELFGYERGAFTGAIAQRTGKFEKASGGTLLLDEVSEMPVHLQAKLLRVLQEGEVDRLGGHHPIPIRARVIATTNRDPLDLIRQERFRADLFYRLNVLRLDCLPLEGREGAIEALARELLRRACRNEGDLLKVFSLGALEKMKRHSWPGNVRELQNAIERAVLVSETDEIQIEHLDLREMPVLGGHGSGDLAAVEKSHILSTLSRTEGNRSEAARRLGITARTLRNKLKEFGE